MRPEMRITADTVDELIRVTDFLREYHGRVYCVIRGWERHGTTGDLQYSVDVRVPVAAVRGAAGWRVLLEMVKAVCRAWYRMVRN